MNNEPGEPRLATDSTQFLPGPHGMRIEPGIDFGLWLPTEITKYDNVSLEVEIESGGYIGKWAALDDDLVVKLGVEFELLGGTPPKKAQIKTKNNARVRVRVISRGNIAEPVGHFTYSNGGYSRKGDQIRFSVVDVYGAFGPLGLTLNNIRREKADGDWHTYTATVVQWAPQVRAFYEVPVPALDANGYPISRGMLLLTCRPHHTVPERSLVRCTDITDSRKVLARYLDRLYEFSAGDVLIVPG
jgi:hypothetical protein